MFCEGWALSWMAGAWWPITSQEESWAGRIRLWDWHAQTVARELEAELPVLSLAFAPDGAHLLVGHEAARGRGWKIK